MKASRYNFFFKEEGLLFNAVTCGLAQVLPENTDLIEKVLDDPNRDNLSSLDPDIEKKLIEGGFLIEEDVDELDLLEAKYHLARFTTSLIGLTIAPTLDCNFNCTYCYEEKQKGSMNSYVISKIKSLVRSYSNLRRLKVIWYGGEPLLYPEVVLELSKDFIDYCKKRDIEYVAGLVTNGYLLTSDLSKELANTAKIQWLQITLDGPPDVHNLRRPLIGGGDTFDQILKNIISVKSIFKIGVRVNIDKGNYESIDSLLSILSRNGLCNYINVGFGSTWATTQACRGYAPNCMEIKKYSVLELNLKQKLEKYGFVVRPYVPQPIEAPCGGVYPYSYVIAPDGKLYKCWESIGIDSEAVGTLENIGALSQNFIKWELYNPFKIKRCRNCQYMPLCLGGCPQHRLNSQFWRRPKSDCTRWKYNLKEAIKWMAKRAETNPEIIQELS